jgi:hypothetical protein
MLSNWAMMMYSGLLLVPGNEGRSFIYTLSFTLLQVGEIRIGHNKISMKPCGCPAVEMLTSPEQIMLSDAAFISPMRSAFGNVTASATCFTVAFLVYREQMPNALYERRIWWNFTTAKVGGVKVDGV